MSKKDRKRREIARRQNEQRRANVAAASENAVADDGPEGAAPEDAAAATRRRAEQKREYEKRKRAKARGGQSRAPYLWGGGLAMVALAVLGGFLLLSGSGDEDGPNGTPIVTPDARVAALPIDVTIEIETDDNGQNVNPRFIPNAISANAGQVVEIVLTNVGSVAHNLRLAGIDDEYNTRDDWITNPATLFAGDTGTVVVKLDDPGTYAFRCDFHATLQLGTFIVR